MGTDLDGKGREVREGFSEKVTAQSTRMTESQREVEEIGVVLCVFFVCV